MLSVEEMEREEDLSECSSGCESGWTMYLEQSEGNPWDPACKAGGGDWEEDGDDLSMVSDASSGPPHFHEDDTFYCHQCGENGLCCCFPSASSLFSAAAASARKDGKRRKVEAGHDYTTRCHQQTPQGHDKQSCDNLDDTASSPLFSFSQNVCYSHGGGIRPVEDLEELSYGFSASHFKGKTPLDKQLSYLKPSSSFPVKKR